MQCVRQYPLHDGPVATPKGGRLVKGTRLFTLFSLGLVALFILTACDTGSATSTPSGGGTSSSGGLPTLAKKDKYKVGFSQTVSDNPWRLAETKSMQDEAAKRGWDIVVTDA